MINRNESNKPYYYSVIPKQFVKEPVVCSVEIGRERVDAALCDLRVLVLVLTDAVEVFDVAGPPQKLHKVLVMGDDQKLEITLARAALNNSVESKSRGNRDKEVHVTQGNTHFI